MHLKRQKTPKSWPIPRKGTKFVVRPNYNVRAGIPLLILLRNMLKVAKNRKEVKKALQEGSILINNKKVRDEKNPVLFFDTISILPSKKYYRLIITKKGKFNIEEIKEDEVNKKIVKVINKKMLRGKKIQLNLSDGRNFLSPSNFRCKTNDSVLINLRENKIEKCLIVEKGAKVIILGGKHSGERGKIENIDEEKGISELKVDNQKIKEPIKNIMVIE